MGVRYFKTLNVASPRIQLERRGIFFPMYNILTKVIRNGQILIIITQCLYLLHGLHRADKIARKPLLYPNH